MTSPRFLLGARHAALVRRVFVELLGAHLTYLQRDSCLGLHLAPFAAKQDPLTNPDLSYLAHNTRGPGRCQVNRPVPRALRAHELL